MLTPCSHLCLHHIHTLFNPITIGGWGVGGLYGILCPYVCMFSKNGDNYGPQTCWVIFVWTVVHIIPLILTMPGCNICFGEMHNLPVKRQKQSLCLYLVLPHPSQARGCFSVSLSGHLLFATLFDHWYL